MTLPRPKIISLCLSAALWVGAAAYAQSAAPVAVDAAWARATVAGQKATGAFMRLTASETMRLVRVQSPVAGVAEVHEMSMEGNIMKMRAISGLDLPMGKAVELKPGSYHVMLMDLKEPLAKGAHIPLTLVFKNAQGTESQLQVEMPVATQSPSMKGGSVPLMH